MHRAAHIITTLLLIIHACTVHARTNLYLHPPPTEPPSNIVTTHLDIVDSTDGLISLREAILLIRNGTVTPHLTFHLPQGSPLNISLNTELPSLDSVTCTINGRNHGIDSGLVTINGNNEHSIFWFNNSHISIDSLILTNGYNGNPGGAIYARNTSLQLNSCQFINNTASHSGGAIYCGTISGAVPSAVAISQCLFSDNHSQNGGAIVIENCDTTIITSSNFLQNIAATNLNDNHGGAIKINGTPCIIDGCRFIGNTVTVIEHNLPPNCNCHGGAISLNAAYAIIQNNIFNSNLSTTNRSAGAKGGAIYSNNSIIFLHNSAFLADSVVGDGGAIYISGSSNSNSSVVNACTFANCSAHNGLGGALSIQSNTHLHINHCTFTENRAGAGGAIYLRHSNGKIELFNSTLVLNQATDDYSLGGGAILTHSGIMNLCNNILLSNTFNSQHNDIKKIQNATLNGYNNIWNYTNTSPTINHGNINSDTLTSPQILTDQNGVPIPSVYVLQGIHQTFYPPLPNTLSYQRGIPTAHNSDNSLAACFFSNTWIDPTTDLPVTGTLIRDSIDQIGTIIPNNNLAIGAIQPVQEIIIYDK